MAALTTTITDGILEITLDRPKANAIDAQTSRELAETFLRLRDDPTLHVGLITGAGDRIFSAGWDMKAALEAGEMEGADFGPGGFAGLDILCDLTKPIIAAVNGAAIGGGMEICLAADIVIAAEHAYFSLPEAMLGVVADAGGVQRLPRRLPRNVALEFLLTGRRMEAAEAAHWGLVNKVVAADRLIDTARDIARKIAASAPLAVQAIKELTQALDGLPEREAFHAPRQSARFAIYHTMLTSEDHDEGVRAFVEKRAPIWKGR